MRDIERYAAAHPQLGGISRLPPLLQGVLREGVTLDLGCGDGQTVAALVHPSRLVIGIDLSMLRLRSARRFAPAVLSDGLRLPLRDGTVDLVVCRHVIEHVEYDEALAREIGRVLRPGGKAYLETALRLRGAWYPYRNSCGDWMLDPTHAREYRSTTDLLGVLRAGGLRPVRLRTEPLTFPVAHLIVRVLQMIGLGDFERLAEKEQLRVRVPRYREIQAVVTHL